MNNILSRIFSSKDKKFEDVWLSENVYDNHGSEKKLSDDEYIEYHIWEDLNCDKMYKKHLPNRKVYRGSNPNLIFHGGCLGCLSQRKHGIDRCKGCQYFKFEHSKPVLFIDGEDASEFNQDDFNDLFS